MSVCVHDRTKTAETITRLAKLATERVIMSPCYAFNIMSKVKVTGSQSPKTYLNTIDGRREYALYRMPIDCHRALPVGLYGDGIFFSLCYLNNIILIN